MGKNSPFTFTVTIPANLTSPLGGQLPDGSMFDLNIPPGKLVLTFDFFPSVGVFPAGYYAFMALRRNLKKCSINGGFRGGDFSVRSGG
jgi:hypothetical protein